MQAPSSIFAPMKEQKLSERKKSGFRSLLASLRPAFSGSRDKTFDYNRGIEHRNFRRLGRKGKQVEKSNNNAVYFFSCIPKSH